MDNKKFIIDQFKQVKALGWIKSNRKNNTGVGKTCEDYMGVIENNFDSADLADYEIKSHRSDAASYITLFTKTPTFPRKANAILNEKYGTPYEENPNLNKLHTSMFATKYNTYGDKYSFKLINDKDTKKIKIGVYNINTHELIDDSAGYTYETIEKVLNKKLKNLFYISAERRNNKGTEEFFFNRAEIYTEPSLEKFMNLIDGGQIMYDIRIGSYKSGKKYGKPHDHGSGFRILEKNLFLLYENKEIVE